MLFLVFLLLFFEGCFLCLDSGFSLGHFLSSLKFGCLGNLFPICCIFLRDKSCIFGHGSSFFSSVSLCLLGNDIIFEILFLLFGLLSLIFSILSCFDSCCLLILGSLYFVVSFGQFFFLLSLEQIFLCLLSSHSLFEFSLLKSKFLFFSLDFLIS